MPTHLMADAWKRYRTMRLGVWYPTDGDKRHFVRAIFAKALRAAWADAKSSRAQIEHLRAVAAQAAPIQSAPITLERAGAIQVEIDRLKYAPFGVNIAARETELRAELNSPITPANRIAA